MRNIHHKTQPARLDNLTTRGETTSLRVSTREGGTPRNHQAVYRPRHHLATQNSTPKADRERLSFRPPKRPPSTSLPRRARLTGAGPATPTRQVFAPRRRLCGTFPSVESA